MHKKIKLYFIQIHLYAWHFKNSWIDLDIKIKAKKGVYWEFFSIHLFDRISFIITLDGRW